MYACMLAECMDRSSPLKSGKGVETNQIEPNQRSANEHHESEDGEQCPAPKERPTASCLKLRLHAEGLIDPPQSEGLAPRSFLRAHGHYRMVKPIHERTTSTRMTTIIVPNTPSPTLFFPSPNVIPHDGLYRLYQLGVFSATNRVYCKVYVPVWGKHV